MIRQTGPNNIMNTHCTHRVKAAYDHEKLFQQLLTVVRDRNEGFLTLAEYEEALDAIRDRLPPRMSLREQHLRWGGTRFWLQEDQTGELVDALEFQGEYCAER